jgi:sugar phosphate isomerase/epimerase
MKERHMKKVPIALQLFAVRGEVAKSVPETLKQVAKIGYEGAEPWGYDGKAVAWRGYSPAELRKMYDDNGLRCCGIHLSTDALLGDNLKRTIELNKALGNNFLIIAGDKPRTSSLAGIAELATILNDTAEKLKPEKMACGYHAHGFDFGVIDGEVAWHRLFSQTKPEVIMQIDIGNSASGGGDPIAALRKFPGRARSVHLKEWGGPKPAVIGKGTMDWKTIFELCRTQQPVEWYVIEEGGEDGNGFDLPAQNLAAVKAMGL